MNAVDTNVLIYLLDTAEPVKQAKARALLSGLMTGSTPTILSWQVASACGDGFERWSFLRGPVRPTHEPAVVTGARRGASRAVHC
jgi:predicted nucleic acid-binding protein